MEDAQRDDPTTGLDSRLRELLWGLAPALTGGLALAAYAVSGSVAVGVLALGAGVAASIVAQRQLCAQTMRPLRALLTAVAQVARGDYAIELEAKTLGALAPYSEMINSLCANQRRLSGELSHTLSRLQQVPERVYDSMQEIDAGRVSTEEAVEETESLLANINTSIQGIGSEVESLSRSTEEASSCILEMQNSIEEVARNAGLLHDSVDSSTSTIHEISASIRQVAESADAVQTMAEESAVAMTQMDRAIQEVGEHVREAAELTDQVNQRADEGAAAVTATIEGIASIRHQTLDAKEVLERLADRIGEIGEIVDVIGSINAETNLLSLNAAIIAAQAGEHGKAFAVVANHVKTLAQRTGQSTQEIEALIRAVQNESSNAVAAMAAGIDAVEIGVERSRKAGEELASIRASSQEASTRVTGIARASQEQTRNSKHVAQAAQRTSSMVQQISTAMAEQSRSGDAMLKSSEEALELCRQVHRATEEQRESSRFVTASISSISEMIHSIQRNTETHGVASQAVADAVGRILDMARKSGERTPEVMSSLEELRQLVESLAGAAGAQAEDGRPEA